MTILPAISFITRLAITISTLLFIYINYSPAFAASTIPMQLRVFADGDLPDEGWLILQVNQKGKPLLHNDDREKRGHVAYFSKGKAMVNYKGSFDIGNSDDMDIPFLQIENTGWNNRIHQVRCRGYHQLKGHLGDYLIKHKDLTALDIGVYVSTKYIEGGRPDLEDPQNGVVDNSLCNVLFTINDEVFPKK